MLELTLLLILVIDPFGAMAALAPIMQRFSKQKQRKIILRESFVATILLLAFAWLGESLLSSLGLAQHSLSLTGGIVLFLIALEMVFPGRKRERDETNQTETAEEPFIVPIAVPLFAGPSALATVSISAAEKGYLIVTGAILLAMFASYLIQLASPMLFTWIGKRGTTAIEKLMGILLIAISVQMFLNGLQSYLAQL